MWGPVLGHKNKKKTSGTAAALYIQRNEPAWIEPSLRPSPTAL